MAKFEDGCYGSLKGIALIAKVLAGRCRMHYTRVAAGKGTIPDDLTPKTLMEPPDYVMDAMISAVTNPVDGECQVSVQINSADVENGFYVTWLILYAEDPDEGEVPFTALCLENEPEWIRPSSSIVGKLAHFDIIAAVGDVDCVSATIDPDAIATYAAVRQLIAESIADINIEIPASGWIQGDGNDRYPWRCDLVVEGVSDYMIPNITIMEQSETAAVECGLRPSAETMDGFVRFRAVIHPKTDIRACLTLLHNSISRVISGDAVIGELPIATANTAGAVKPGVGLLVDSDGTLSLDTATDEEFRELLDGKEGT